MSKQTRLNNVEPITVKRETVEAGSECQVCPQGPPGRPGQPGGINFE